MRLQSNMWVCVVPVLVLLALSSPAFGDSALSDDFNNGTLDFTAWCPCQIKLKKSPYTFPADPSDSSDHMLSIPIDGYSLGGNVCRRKAPDYECEPPPTTVADLDNQELDDDTEIEPLGPSFFDDDLDIQGIDPTRTNPYCTDAVMKRALAAKEEDECYQRQEIRVQEEKVPPATERYIYEIRFRMPQTVHDQTNSIRWIIGQWKQEPVSRKYEDEFGDKWGPSPFLAQRYDDGVLHITVQDKHCRCLVASAPHPNGKKIEWTDGAPKECVSTHPSNEGATCTSALSLKFGQNPILDSPAGQFVDMKYIVQAGRDSAAQIDIFQNGRFIVSVLGKIGYDTDASTSPVTKFKIGHYRDYMPYDYVMDIDRIKIEKSAP